MSSSSCSTSSTAMAKLKRREAARHSAQHPTHTVTNSKNDHCRRSIGNVKESRNRFATPNAQKSSLTSLSGRVNLNHRRVTRFDTPSARSSIHDSPPSRVFYTKQRQN
uniref:Uncharacterized protein n=1 Tax=Lygus hesperus TaxID=30085 RepID=A0A146M543_LYGHE